MSTKISKITAILLLAVALVLGAFGASQANAQPADGGNYQPNQPVSPTATPTPTATPMPNAPRQTPGAQPGSATPQPTTYAPNTPATSTPVPTGSTPTPSGPTATPTPNVAPAENYYGPYAFVAGDGGSPSGARGFGMQVDPAEAGEGDVGGTGGGDSTLAYTGSSTTAMVAVGISLLAFGGTALVAARRRR